MRFGVVFPQTEIGTDPGAIRDFAQAVEEMGYDHLLAYDHVLGADVTDRPGWLGYTSDDMFHEVFVLFGYLAAVTRRLELVTGILILPQRQTALVAKQAAEVDVLSGGRLRLGVGLGWNSVEYEALGMDFRRRGATVEEQIHVLRLLWTQPVVTFHGRRHRITRAGINPLPVQRPIPIWMGGESEAAIRRTARLADGWFPGGTLRNERERLPQQDRAEQVDRLRRYARAAGRDPARIGLEGRIAIGRATPDQWRQEVERWRSLGATHVTVVTMRAGLATPGAHIDAVRRFLSAVRP
ncbi:MAG: LLM class F420-dependent oxidoreductase [Armatimonadota bacterium]|nr:LLM class F420-dependent oxidoreductase [Armatimonadota bacterium]MDR7486674.1 LLM class F420-dependent oxidoreductase [Armatimonadota bacterium]MDR7534672.1 LLM class F420-dependent oxidoreductase [Armatimonadota bacterium]MDR7535073.1 LLM class F420-dependent oxidoreductase [Armatimonadota bacterium]